MASYVDYTSDAISKLLWQYRDSTTIQTMLSTFTDSLNISQQDTFDIVDSFNIDNAEGDMLDFVGKLIGETRGGRSDSEFKDGITLKVLFNTSQGTPNKIMEAIGLATNATKVKIYEHYPYSAVYETNGDVFPVGLSEAIQNASPVTSGNTLIFSNSSGGSFYPSEIDISMDTLITNEDDEIVTNNDDELEVVNLIVTNPTPEYSMLSEYTYGEGSGTEKDTPDGLGILCEIL